MTTTDRNTPDSPRPALHDPLLHGPRPDSPAVRGTDGTPPAPPVPPPPAPLGRRKSKHPALSARILATGLATTGTLGLTAGYALSAPGSSTDTTLAPVATFPQTGTAATVPSGQAPSPSAPATTAPAVPGQATNAPAPVVTVAPPVVVLQIPDIAPANPGSSAGSGGNNWQDPGNQQSSGSN